MKKITLFASLLLSLCSFAETLDCTTYAGDDDYGAGLFDRLELNCIGTSSREFFDVKISGFGPSLRLNAMKKAALVCPFREGRDVEGDYYGTKAELSIIGGLNGGLFYNSSQACILGGLNVGGLGAGIVGAKMSIKLSH